MKSRYLVTAIGGDIGSSVIRHLGKEFPKEALLGCDIIPHVSGYDYAGDFFLVPPYAEENKYVDAILKECGKRGITHILPMTEGEIMLFDKFRQVFYSAGIKVMINNSRILKIAMSKYCTAKAIKDMGLDSPKTWKPEEMAENIQYPIIIKSDTGCGSKKVRIANNKQEYDMALAELSNAIVQEYIGTPEEEYTMGVFSNGTDIKSIAFRRKLGGGGMTCWAELIEDGETGRIAEVVAHAFGLRGSINIQMRKQNGKYYIFEINPRISSTVGFRYLLGFKDVLWWLDFMDGKTERIHYLPESLPVVAVRTYGEKVFRKDIQYARK